MRVGMPAVSGSIEGNISPIFGRAPYFVFVDVDNGKIVNSYAKTNMDTSFGGGRGVRAAQMIVNEGCNALIVLSLGPNSYDLISASGIRIYKGINASIKENVEKFIADELIEMKNLSPGRFARGYGQKRRMFGRGRW